jgi:hypothetical protein
MTVARRVADVLDEHVVLEIESIDRMYLNVWQPRLAYGGGVQGFFVGHRGYHYASTALMDPMTKAFVADIHGLDRARRGVIRHRPGPVLRAAAVGPLSRSPQVARLSPRPGDVGGPWGSTMDICATVAMPSVSGTGSFSSARAGSAERSPQTSLRRC